MASERGRERCAIRPVLRATQLVPQIERRLSAGFLQPLAERANLGMRRRQQMADLLLERADADDLADVGRHGEWQHVADDVEGPSGDVSRIDRFLHLVGARILRAQRRFDRREQLAIGREQAVRRRAKRLALRLAQLRGHVNAERGEVLIPAGLGLSVPDALVFDVNQEPTNNVRRQVLHLQLIHCLTELFGRMRQEQGQGVAVAGLRVARQVEVPDEMLEKMDWYVEGVQS